MGHAHTVTPHPKDSTNGNGRSGGLHGEFAWRAFERAGGSPSDDDPRIRTPISKPLDAALTKIHDWAVKEALSPTDDEDDILLSSNPNHHVPIPQGNWTREEAATLEAAVKHYRACAAAYRDNPEPVGRACSDTSAYLRYFQTAIPTGRHREVLRSMPQWERHILETCRTAGSEILMPHPAPEDPTPRFLRDHEIARRAGIDLMQAGEFSLFFSILDLDATAVDHYTTGMRRHTRPDLFKPVDLARNPGYHPDILAIQLARLAAEMLELEPDDVLTQETASVTTYYDTDIGCADKAQLAFEALDAEASEDPAAFEQDNPEAFQEVMDEIGSPDLVTTESTDEEEDPYLTDGDDSRTEGQFETIAYHRQGHGDNEEDPLDGDPLYEQIRLVTPEKVAPLKKLLWQEQKAGSPWVDKSNRKHFRSRAAWTTLWLLLKAREDYYTDTSIILKRALRAIEATPNYKALRHLGAKVYAQSKHWPTYARRKFWAQYNQKKQAYEASLQPAA